jgi:hypothetical protein
MYMNVYECILVLNDVLFHPSGPGV